MQLWFSEENEALRGPRPSPIAVSKRATRRWQTARSRWATWWKRRQPLAAKRRLPRGVGIQGNGSGPGRGQTANFSPCTTECTCEVGNRVAGSGAPLGWATATRPDAAISMGASSRAELEQARADAIIAHRGFGSSGGQPRCAVWQVRGAGAARCDPLAPRYRKRFSAIAGRTGCQPAGGEVWASARRGAGLPSLRRRGPMRPPSSQAAAATGSAAPARLWARGAEWAPARCRAGFSHLRRRGPMRPLPWWRAAVGSCSLLLFCGLLMPTRSLGEVGRSVTELAEVELLLFCGLRMPARFLGEVGPLRHRAGGGRVAAVLWPPDADSLAGRGRPTPSPSWRSSSCCCIVASCCCRLARWSRSAHSVTELAEASLLLYCGLLPTRSPACRPTPSPS